MEYEERIVIFIDILGTKEIVNRTVESAEALERIVSLLDNIIYSLRSLQSTFCHTKNYEIAFDTTHFSDSFVVSIKVDPDQVITLCGALLLSIDILAVQFLQKQILIRGGITIGKLIHTDKVLFGPALVEAYNLESQFAVYPRIIFSQQIIDFIDNFYQRTNSASEIWFLSIDDDGFYYYDYFLKHSYTDVSRIIEHYWNILDCFDLIKANSTSLNAKKLWLKAKLKYILENVDFDLLVKRLDFESERAIIYNSEQKELIRKLILDFRNRVSAFD